jgi:hypothetical protein
MYPQSRYVTKRYIYRFVGPYIYVTLQILLCILRKIASAPNKYEFPHLSTLHRQHRYTGNNNVRIVLNHAYCLASPSCQCESTERVSYDC